MTRACRQEGFTYLLLLWWVAISGVMLAALGHSWSLDARRQREAELVFRGEQMVRALQSYGVATPAGQVGLPLRLDELVEDRRQEVVVHHLRRHWPDPITGQAWGLVLEGDRIKGVFSTSTSAPVSGPAHVHRYEDWRFEVSAIPPTASSQASPP